MPHRSVKKLGLAIRFVVKSVLERTYFKFETAAVSADSFLKRQNLQMLQCPPLRLQISFEGRPERLTVTCFATAESGSVLLTFVSRAENCAGAGRLPKGCRQCPIMGNVSIIPQGKVAILRAHFVDGLLQEHVQLKKANGVP